VVPPESAERKSFRHQVHNKYVKKIYGRSAPECEPFCPLATCWLCGKVKLFEKIALYRPIYAASIAIIRTERDVIKCEHIYIIFCGIVRKS